MNDVANLLRTRLRPRLDTSAFHQTSTNTVPYRVSGVARAALRHAAQGQRPMRLHGSPAFLTGPRRTIISAEQSPLAFTCPFGQLEHGSLITLLVWGILSSVDRRIIETGLGLEKSRFLSLGCRGGDPIASPMALLKLQQHLSGYIGQLLQRPGNVSLGAVLSFPNLVVSIVPIWYCEIEHPFVESVCWP